MWQVKRKRDNSLHALKILSKAKILSKNSVKAILNERHILSKLNHPYCPPASLLRRFIVNMTCAFQDQENLYIVLDLMPGGDLRSFITRSPFVTERQASIFFVWR